MHDLHVYNDEKQLLINGDFTRGNFSGTGLEPATFRPTSSSLQPSPRFLGLLQRTGLGQALTGSQYSEVPSSDCYCQYLGHQQTNPDPVYPIRVAIYLIDWQVPAMVQSHVRLWDVTFNSHLKLIGFCFQWQNAWWPFQCCQPCIHLLAWVSNQRFCWRHHHLSQQLKNFEGQWKFFQGGKTVSDQLDWSKFGFLLLLWRIQIDLFA